MNSLRIRSLVVGIAARVALFGLLASLGACIGDHEPGLAVSPTSAAQIPTPASVPAPPPTVTVTPPPEPPFAQLTCAPCKKIVFTSSRDGNDEIYTVNADGTGLTRLTDDPARDDNAVWSPDGARIAFTSYDGSDSRLAVMAADGSNVVRHALPHRFVSDATWSPDGTRIAYAALSDGSLNVWVVAAEGGAPASLLAAPGWDAEASWSPDGSKLAVVSDWLAYDIAYDVFLIGADGAGFAPLTDGNIFDRIDYRWPSWSPDGTMIATTINQEIGIDRYLAYIGVMHRDGSGLAPLIAAAPFSRSSWSPDGTMIVFASGSSGAQNVSWVKADGSAWGTIVTNGRNPDWQH